jgi:hypothetical protein
MHLAMLTYYIEYSETEDLHWETCDLINELWSKIGCKYTKFSFID